MKKNGKQSTFGKNLTVRVVTDLLYYFILQIPVEAITLNEFANLFQCSTFSYCNMPMNEINRDFTLSRNTYTKFGIDLVEPLYLKYFIRVKYSN